MFEKIMTRTFIQTDEFVKQWALLGFNDDDLRRLELMIMRNPEVGPVMQGTGGLRKMRFAYEGRGKSGSTRVCYVDFLFYDTVYLITVFPKSKKANLNKAEKNEVKKMIAMLEEQAKELHGGDGDE